MIKNLQAFFNPEQFQGWSKKKKYFEGWYYKVINQEESKAFAFIPGIAIDEKGQKHSFIQILDGKKGTARYLKFPGESFKPSKGKFEIHIDQNSFSENHMHLDAEQVHGKLEFEGNVPWPKPFYSPGIMGPYAFVPFMECYHGIVSMNHAVKGILQIDGETIDFTHGRGYIEKDWGRSFPSAYTWMQTNHFSKEGISFKASVAKIPWIRNAFVGYIAGLWWDNQLYRFTTYNSTALRKCIIDKEQVEIVLSHKKYELSVYAHRNNATTLASPILGLMDGRIEESMTSKVEVMLKEKKSNRIIFHDTGNNAGLEVAGNIREIIV